MHRHARTDAEEAVKDAAIRRALDADEMSHTEIARQLEVGKSRVTRIANDRAPKRREPKSLEDRFAIRLRQLERLKPCKVWLERDMPEGWSIDSMLRVGSGGAPGEYRWHAVHDLTGAVDGEGFTHRSGAVRRAWELAVQAERALRGAA